MATLILAAAGQAFGGFLAGSFGAALGQAAGALAGGVLDRALFSGGSRRIEGPRLADLDVQSSAEGAALPFVYGRTRLAGQVIWATRFEEEVTTEHHGAKGGGGTSVTRYRYFANFAVALAQGPVSHVGRIWADGKPLDLTGVTCRVHLGRPDQPADPLIAAKQGETPAYRDTAYVVFERLALEPFGNRLPQLAFEVIRVVEPLEGMVRAITVIPGAGEFVYGNTAVTLSPREGVTERVNRHVDHAATDFEASIDELMALCPNLESVALVVAWFADDLRCGSATIRPKVENAERATSEDWVVGGLGRGEAEAVSLVDGTPAYGGTPSDPTVMAAIAALKARGLKVLLYPFVLMDVPAGNGLPDPYGGAEQAAYPWRGRITASAAPGRPGSPDGTAAAAAEVAAFVGTAAPGDFAPGGSTVTYSGSPEWSYRRFVLHHAHLAAAAGGVDALLIGSEMRGLTRLCSAPGVYPFVTALADLAADVRTVVGPETKIGYAADWSEYGGEQRPGGELRFPLDPLWAHGEVDFIGIDNYLPLADQRDGGDPEGCGPYDLEALRAHVAGGEYFDWYYVSDADRRAGVRSAIGDGAYGKPWVFRAKDILGWWSNPHHERVGGVELAAPTAWVPMSKPIWFTELGCPAVDKGANQPNVFVDPKSAESALPHFSTGARDDLVQRRALEAALGYWAASHPVLEAGANPVSPVYDGPMVDPATIHLWTWDARPFPVFPAQREVWADATNWRFGHWLTGRLGGVTLEGLVRALAADHGLDPTVLRAEALPGWFEGLAVSGPISLRAVLEPLLDGFGAVASDRGTEIVLHPAWTQPVAELCADDLADPSEDGMLLTLRRSHASDLPAEVRFSGRDPLADHRTFAVASQRLEGESGGVEQVDLGVTVDRESLAVAAEQRLLRFRTEREVARFALGPHRIDLEPGDVVTMAADPALWTDRPATLRIAAIEDAGVRWVEAVTTAPPPVVVRRGDGAMITRRTTTSVRGAAEVLILDLPALPGTTEAQAPRIACFAMPWPGAYQVYRRRPGGSLERVVTVDLPATMGQLATALTAGPTGRWDRVTSVEVELSGGALQAAAELDLYAGANTLAVAGPNGRLELLQFREAELVGTRRYRLSGLLRGQLGTEAAAAVGCPAGSRVVLIDGRLGVLPVGTEGLGSPGEFRVVAAGDALDGPTAVTLQHTATGLGLKPLAPVHASARREAGGVRFRWIRRGRIDADSWQQSDIPLGEETEAYELDLLGDGGAVLATLSSALPEVLLPAAQETALYGGSQSAIAVRIHQLSRAVGRGHPLERTLDVD